MPAASSYFLMAATMVACGGGGSAAGGTNPAPAVASVNCSFVADSLKASTTGVATSAWDSTYAYIASNGIATHPMMNGITATNLQVPLAVNFSGANAWKIPLAPAIAAATNQPKQILLETNAPLLVIRFELGR